MAPTDKDASDALRADIDRIRDDIAALTQTVKSLAGSEGAAIYERARTQAEHLRDEGEQLAQSAGRTVSERPLTSVLAAFVVGLLLGMLFARRG